MQNHDGQDVSVGPLPVCFSTGARCVLVRSGHLAAASIANCFQLVLQHSQIFSKLQLLRTEVMAWAGLSLQRVGTSKDDMN